MNIHELVLKPTVTCGSPILRNPLFRVFLKIGYPQNSSVDHSPRYGESMWIVPSFFGPICVQECILAAKMIYIYIYICGCIYVYTYFGTLFFGSMSFLSWWANRWQKIPCWCWFGKPAPACHSSRLAWNVFLVYSIPWFHCWWFQTFFIVHNIWDNPSHWRAHIFQDGYCTTKQFFLVYSIPWFRDVFE